MTSNIPGRSTTSSPGARGTRADHDHPSGSSAQPEKPGLDLSLTQTLGGALAAMTAAALGSRLGVGGTIIGAAVASIIAGVAGSLYTASLRHTGAKVKTVWGGRAVGTGGAAGSPVAGSATASPTSAHPAVDAPEASGPAPSNPRFSVGSSARRASIPWKAMLAGAAAIFAIAFVALTGLELLAGTALSGERGTTIEQVSRPNQPATTPSTDVTEPASPSPTESTSEVSPSPTAPSTQPTPQPTAPSPTDVPSATVSAPAPAPAPTEQPTEEPTQDETPAS